MRFNLVLAVMNQGYNSIYRNEDHQHHFGVTQGLLQRIDEGAALKLWLKRYYLHKCTNKLGYW